LHEVAEELEAFIVPTLEPPGCVLAFLEALRVGTENDITFACEGGAGVLGGIARETCRFAFSEMPLAIVLVPDRDRRGGMCRIDAIGDEEQCGDPVEVVVFQPPRSLVGERLDAESFLLHRLPGHGMERPGLGPGAAEASEETGTESFGGHVRRGCGSFSGRLREKSGEGESGGGLLQEEAAVRIGHGVA
jgi:hypothetical protein